MSRKNLSGVFNELAAVRADLQENRLLEDHPRLASRISALETDVQMLLSEAEHWRHRCLELERDLATSVAAEDKALMDLRTSHNRERDLAARNVQLHLNKADADNAATKSEVEVREHQCELRMREQQLETMEAELRVARDTETLHAGRTDAIRRLHASELNKKDSQLDATCAELTRARRDANDRAETLRRKEAELETTQALLRKERLNAQQSEDLLKQRENEMAKLRSEMQDALSSGRTHRMAHEALLLRSSGQTNALDDAARRSEELEAKVASLEQDLVTQVAKHADYVREAEVFRTRSDHCESINQKLRLDLQDALSPRMEVGPIPRPWTPPCEPGDPARSPPWRHGHSVPRFRTKAPPSPPHAPPPSSLILSGRQDYPRGSMSRRLQREVLSARLVDRTAATDRYDTGGHLVSFDSSGRAVP